MSSRSTLLADAQRVLDTIIAETRTNGGTVARDRFTTAYRGPGDAIAALQQFVHPSDPGDLDDLRAAAFGRADSADAEARAVEARKTLQARDAAEATASDAIAAALERYNAARPPAQRGTTETAGAVGAAASAHPTETPSTGIAPAASPTGSTTDPASAVVVVEGGLVTDTVAKAPRRPTDPRRRRTVLLTVGAFVVGVAVAAGGTFVWTAREPSAPASSAPVTPSARDTELPSGASGDGDSNPSQNVASGVTNGGVTSGDGAFGDTSQLHGNIIAATTRLAKPAKAGDRMDADSYYDNTIDPSASRRLWGNRDTDQVFVYRNKAGDFCMSLVRTAATLGTCLTLVEFQRSGLQISSTAEDDPKNHQSVVATWDGLRTSLVIGS